MQIPVCPASSPGPPTGLGWFGVLKGVPAVWKQPGVLCSQKCPQGKVFPERVPEAPNRTSLLPSQVGWEDANFQQLPCSKAVLVLPCRFAYKDEYEKFKLYLTIILLIVSFSCRFLLNSR